MTVKTRQQDAVARERVVTRWLTGWAIGLTLLCLAGASLLWVGANPYDSSLLPLREVRIEGDLLHLKQQELEQAISGLVRGGFFTVDVVEVRERAQRLPWVDRVSVRRIWPDRLVIRVEEQVPLARWGERGLVNGRGELFRPERMDLPEELPRLDGPEGSEVEVVARYLTLRRRFGLLGLRLDRIRLDRRGAWTVAFRDGAVIRLGSRDTEERLARFLRIYPLLKGGERRMRDVDLRYTNGFAVRWEQNKTKDGPDPVMGSLSPNDRGLV